MTPTTWGIIAIALIAVILLAIRNKTSGRANGGQLLESANDQSKAETVSATIIRKDISSPAAKPQPTFYYTSTQNRPRGAKIFGVLTIRIDGGKEKKFNVSKKDFCKVTEGDHGKLTYLGYHFIHFELDEKKEA